MKLLLSFAVLLISSQIAFADATLVYVIPVGPVLDRQVNYKLKDHMLRIDQVDTSQYKLYDHNQQTLLHVDGKTGNISRIDNQDVESRVELLNLKRLQKLTEVEARLKNRLNSQSPEEKRLAEELLNQLKYPEFYGAHTYLRVQKTGQMRNIQKVPCQVYNITRNEEVLKQLCMASQQDLKLSDSDYTTLRGFYHFNYTVQTRLRIAAGKTDFVQIDYDRENIAGIPIEVIRISDKDKKPEFFLHSRNGQLLDKGQFDRRSPLK